MDEDEDDGGAIAQGALPQTQGAVAQTQIHVRRGQGSILCQLCNQIHHNRKQCAGKQVLPRGCGGASSPSRALKEQRQYQCKDCSFTGCWPGQQYEAMVAKHKTKCQSAPRGLIASGNHGLLSRHSTGSRPAEDSHRDEEEESGRLKKQQRTAPYGKRPAEDEEDESSERRRGKTGANEESWEAFKSLLVKAKISDRNAWRLWTKSNKKAIADHGWPVENIHQYWRAGGFPFTTFKAFSGNQDPSGNRRVGVSGDKMDSEYHVAYIEMKHIDNDEVPSFSPLAYSLIQLSASSYSGGGGRAEAEKRQTKRSDRRIEKKGGRNRGMRGRENKKVCVCVCVCV